MLSLEEIKERILRKETIENIIKDINWKEFEKLISEVLEKHDFKIKQNFRFKTKRRYEIDILAIRNGQILVIDCKYWNSGRYKKSSLKSAIIKQKERAKELEKFLKKNIVAKKMLKVQKSSRFIPLLATWQEEDLVEYENILVVPVWKLNEFLLNISSYI